MTRVRGWWSGHPLASAGALLLLAAAILPALAAAAAAAPDVEPPSVPGNVAAAPGAASPEIATITWTASTDDVGVAAYTVWRATNVAGPYKLLGTTPETTFTDGIGVPGQGYYYFVSARDDAGNDSTASAPVGPVRSAWTAAPHRSYTSSTQACASCHAVHDAAATAGLMRDTGSSEPAGEVAVCYTCHDGQGADSNIRTGAADSFALSSGHAVEDTAAGGDLTNRCSSCHDAHADPDARRMVPARIVNGRAVPGPGNAWCLSCHDDANSWYGAGYPTADAPVRDAAGYPVSGTFPGASVYASASAHAAIPETTQTPASGEPVAREQGSCLYCHAAHRGPGSYDGLRAPYRPTTASTLASDQADGTYAASCFECHGGTTPSGFSTAPADVKRFATGPASSAGHRVKTAGGTLPVGSPLPCYECHAPHGSARGNASMLSDTLGASLETSSAAGARRFCLTCHTTHDTERGWDSTASAYASPPADATVVGIPRFNGSLALPAVAGHDEADTQSCYDCHGNDYTDGGSNVHAPVFEDVTPPVTISDVQPSYVGPATIVLTATDDSVAGVAHTYYQLDSGVQTEGVVINVPQPPSGSQDHTMTVWSVDAASNIETPTTSQFTITADTVGPSTTATFTNDGINVNMTLNPDDPAPSAGIDSVHVMSADPTLGGFDNGGEASWTGTSWVMTSWWNTQGIKSVTYWSTDKAGNVGPSNTSTIAADWEPPVTSSDATSSYSGTAIITLSATDIGSGVAATYYKDGSTGTTQTGEVVTISAPTSGTDSHTIYFWSVDNVGYAEGSKSETFAVSALEDTIAPSGTMSIDNDSTFATVTSASVDSAVNDTGTGVSQMRIDPGSGVYDSWMAYSATQPFALSGADGVKTVRAEYRDVAGNTATLTDTITLDTVAPSGTMFVNSDAATTSSTSATVDSAMSDATSGMSVMRIDVTGTGSSYGAWLPFAASFPVTLPSGDGTKTVLAEYADEAGLVTTLSDTILVVPDTTPPSTSSDAVVGYVDSAAITLAAQDESGGSGAAHTYYNLDNGGQAEGTTVSTSVIGAHTLEFWSVDYSGNVENPHNSVDFSVHEAGSAVQTFVFTGADQTYTVPDGVTTITADLYGGAGGDKEGVPGGRGGYVQASIPVTPGQVLTVKVGGGVGDGGIVGGWPNGGFGDGTYGAAGGGSSSIASGTSILVEAGGGGGADHTNNLGGEGGYSGWLPGGNQTGDNQGGAGGGGGWNGGAAYAPTMRGGDGGTSYIAAGIGTLTPGAQSGNGSIVITPVTSQTFSPSGADQSFTVPTGVTSIFVDLYGSQGGNAGGLGGRVHALIPVTPGQVLTVKVGDSSGWPTGGSGTALGGAGGGSSSVLLGPSVLAEAGGGGGFATGGGPGGPGGAGAATDPGGNQNGANGQINGAGGGGGWNGGDSPGDGASGSGGTSRIAVGSGTLTPGTWTGDGMVAIAW